MLRSTTDVVFFDIIMCYVKIIYNCLLEHKIASGAPGCGGHTTRRQRVLSRLETLKPTSRRASTTQTRIQCATEEHALSWHQDVS